MYQLSINLRKQAKDKAEGIIYFKIGRDSISTGIPMQSKFWNPEEWIVKRTHPRYLTINPTYQLYRSRAEQCISNYHLSGLPFDKEFFKQYVFLSPEWAANPGFYSIMENYYSIKKMGWSRIKQYQFLISDMKMVEPGLKLHQVTPAFITRLQKYLQNKENNENTITRKIKMIKAVVHDCQVNGQLSKDPLAPVKLKQILGNKLALTADELSILERAYYTLQLPSKHREVLRYFLFSCYTALRYSDIINFHPEHVVNGNVVLMQEKTDKPVMVPLIPQALQLLHNEPGEKYFRVNSNQSTNRLLKEIMLLTGIQKKITYHCSRHTFGTLSIYWGIPLEVVAELMGVDFKTVKIYAKIVDEVKVREMAKWGKKVVG